MDPNTTYYEESMRYIEDAKETLTKAGVDPVNPKLYKNHRYVKSAAGTAYAGVEQSAKWFLELNGYGPAKKYKSADAIMDDLRKVNIKALGIFDECYKMLHIYFYYQNGRGIRTMKEALETAKQFISFLKPYNKQYVYKKGGKIRTMFTVGSKGSGQSRSMSNNPHHGGGLSNSGDKKASWKTAKRVYSKTHASKEALHSHIKKIEARNGSCYYDEDTLKVRYIFPAK